MNEKGARRGKRKKKKDCIADARPSPPSRALYPRAPGIAHEHAPATVALNMARFDQDSRRFRRYCEYVSGFAEADGRMEGYEGGHLPS